MREGAFDLEFLNHNILNFQYAQIDKANNPQTLPVPLCNFRVKLTAAECANLLRLLPWMLGNHVEVWNVFYSVLLDLLDAVEALCACVHVQDLVELFLTKNKKMFPDERIKPKAHYMLHYAKEIEMFGPLTTCQTLRFERKHNYFKEVSYRTKNRMNICKTLATRHQNMQVMHHAKI